MACAQVRHGDGRAGVLGGNMHAAGHVCRHLVVEQPGVAHLGAGAAPDLCLRPKAAPSPILDCSTPGPTATAALRGGGANDLTPNLII